MGSQNLANGKERRCLRCPQTEHLTRSHVPMRLVSKLAFGSLKKAFRAGKFQIYWLCEDCRRQHQALESALVQRRMLDLTKELEELHRSFVASVMEQK